MSLLRTRWAAIGAAVAVTLGAGGIGLVSATGPSGAVTLVPITPCRLIDTRPGTDNVGPFEAALGAGQTITVSAHGDNGRCSGIPTGATGLSLNVTAVGASQPSFFTIWPTGAAQPNSSSINPVPGEPPTPNAVTTKLSPGGQFEIFNLAGQVDVIVDVNGYYVDHDHDDRYYTKTESDARFSRSPALPIEINTFDLRPEELGPFDPDGNNWVQTQFLTHTSSAVNECVFAAVEAPVGAVATFIEIGYTGGVVDLISSIVEVERRTGAVPVASETIALGGVDLPASNPGQIASGKLELGNPVPFLADHDYAVRLCAQDAVSIFSLRII